MHFFSISNSETAVTSAGHIKEAKQNARIATLFGTSMLRNEGSYSGQQRSECFLSAQTARLRYYIELIEGHISLNHS